jgi:TolB-like protein
MGNPDKLTRFWHELKRRKVVGVIIVYATTAFILMQLAQVLEGSLNLPAWFDTVITIALIIGFPIAIIFSWIFNVSSKGIVKTEPEIVSEKISPIEPEKIVPDKSIIVLPFENISSDSEQEYFSDGLTEEIITDLSHINDLLVISRSSAMTFKGTKQTIKEIAGKVNVRYVLEGSVRKSGNQLRIVAQLIDAQSDTHIWAEKYEEALENIFLVQEKISGLITKSLKIRLTEKEKNKLKEHSEGDLVALECWFRAKQEIHHLTKDSLDRASTILKDGLNETGETGILLWGLGYINWFYFHLCIFLDDKYLQKAEYYAKKIFNINKESSYGYQLLGLIYYKRWETKKSILYMQKALEIDPNNPEALDHIIWMYADVGKTHKSHELLTKLLTIDPLTTHNHWAKGLTLLVEGKFEKSILSFTRAHELDPENIQYIIFYAYGLFMANRTEKALEIITPHEKKPTDDVWVNFLIYLKNAFLKDHAGAFQFLKEEIFAFAEWVEILCLILAQSFSLLNEKDRALIWLEKATKKGFINYPFLSAYDHTLENIREEERFKKLMKKVKKEWEDFEV